MEQLFQGGFFYDARVTHISLLTAISEKGDNYPDREGRLPPAEALSASAIEKTDA
jgi:hypothetical protein